MTTSVRKLLENEELKIPEKDIDILGVQWDAIQSLKKKIPVMPPGDFDISLRNVPGGDHIE